MRITTMENGDMKVEIGSMKGNFPAYVNPKLVMVDGEYEIEFTQCGHVWNFGEHRIACDGRYLTPEKFINYAFECEV